jgi:hypothetical protein
MLYTILSCHTLEPVVLPVHNVDTDSFALYCFAGKRFVEHTVSMTARPPFLHYSLTPFRLESLARVRHRRYAMLRDPMGQDALASVRIVEVYNAADYHPGMLSEYDNDRARHHVSGGVRCPALLNYLPAIEVHFNVHPERDDQYFVLLTARPGRAGGLRADDLRRMVPLTGKRRCQFLPDKAALAVLRLAGLDYRLVYDFQAQCLL